MTDRIPCKNPACQRTILHATAERTAGLCMICVQAVAKQERDDYVRKNRRDLNEFQDVTDPVDIIKIIHRPRIYDPLVNRIPYPTPTDQLYQSLNNQQLQRLAEHATGLIGKGQTEEAEEMVRCLAAFTEAKLDDCLRASISQGVFLDGLSFRLAPPDIRDELIARLEWDDDNRNLILLALAWIGDPTVVRLFEHWQSDPPPWAKSFHQPPQNYSRSAGWELVDGQRRDLFFHHCIKLKKGKAVSPDRFKAIIERAETCPWCGSRLTTFFDIGPSMLGGLGGRIQVVACEICAMFGPVFGHIERDGCAQWSQKNSRPKYLPNDAVDWNRLPQDSLSLAEECPALFAACWYLPTTFSQLGGHPTWIQDDDYPPCPECSKTMMFLAQISNEDIMEHAEGIYYTFICPTCRTTAVSYQQS